MSPVSASDAQQPLRAAIYARISLDRSGEGAGVTRQIEDCRALIDDHGWDLVATYCDNSRSASTGKSRPKYTDLLTAVANREVDVVVAWNNDRLHRRMDDLERFVQLMEQTGCLTHTVKSGDLRLNSVNGKLVARLLGSVAAAESDMKGERVQRRRLQEALAGKAHGPLGYGYRADQSIVPAQRAIVVEVAQRLLNGETLYSVAADLNARGVPSPGAGKWTSKHIDGAAMSRPEVAPLVAAMRSPLAVTESAAAALLTAAGATVDVGNFLTSSDLSQWLLLDDSAAPDGQVALLLTRAGVPAPLTLWRAANLGVMIRRGALCGWRDFGPGGRGGRGDMVAQGTWTPILDKATTELLRQLLDSRKAPLRADGRPMGGRPAKFLLSGVLSCGRCGVRLSGYTDSDSGHSKYSCATIPGTSRCGRLSIAGPIVEDAVERLVKAALSGSEMLTRSSDGGAVAKAEEAAAAEIVSIRAEIEMYNNMAGQRSITPADYLDIRDKLNKRMREAERVLGQHSQRLRSALDGVPATSGDLETWWANASLGRRRDVIKALINYIPIAPAADIRREDSASMRIALIDDGVPRATLVRRQRLLSRIGMPVWRA